MQKIKFTIKGMSCRSCAALLTEKLKELGSVIEAKISFDSQKAVVVYDEHKVGKEEIKKIVEQSGGYKVIEELEDPNSAAENKTPEDAEQDGSFKNNILLSVAIFVTGLIIAGAIMFNDRSSLGAPEYLINKQTAQVRTDTNSQPTPTPTPTPALPSPAGNITQFEIAKTDNVRGDFQAPVTLVEFSDFECPFCESHYRTLKEIVNNYEGQVRLVYKHFPLGFHPNAQKAAEASECAGEQGKFWEYHDQLFDNFDLGYSETNFKQWAKDLSLNTRKFNDCLDSGKYAAKIQADYQEGAQKGVSGTPATFINGQLISGALPYESLTQVIDGLLEQ